RRRVSCCANSAEVGSALATARVLPPESIDEDERLAFAQRVDLAENPAIDHAAVAPYPQPDEVLVTGVRERAERLVLLEAEDREQHENRAERQRPRVHGERDAHHAPPPGRMRMRGSEARDGPFDEGLRSDGYCAQHEARQRSQEPDSKRSPRAPA